MLYPTQARKKRKTDFSKNYSAEFTAFNKSVKLSQRGKSSKFGSTLSEIRFASRFADTFSSRAKASSILTTQSAQMLIFKSLNDDVHQTLRHDDDFHNLFAARVFGDFFVRERQFFQIFV